MAQGPSDTILVAIRIMLRIRESKVLNPNRPDRRRFVLSEHSFLVSFCNTHTSVYGTLDYVRDYLGEPVPEPIWILDLQKQETVSGSGISWAICKSAPRSRQITMPVPHHSLLVDNMTWCKKRYLLT